MSDKSTVFNQLLSMFHDQHDRIYRAIRLYERKYDYIQDRYNIEIICEIMFRLELKDSRSKHNKRSAKKNKHYKSKLPPYSKSKSNIDLFDIQNRKKRRSKKNLSNHVGTNISILPIKYSKSVAQQQQQVDASISEDDKYDYQFSETDEEKLQLDLNFMGLDASNNSSFFGQLTFEQAQNLQIGDKIDYRRDDGKFVGANIFNKSGTILYIYYDGQNRQNAFRSNYVNDLHRIAIYKSISSRNITTIHNNNDIRIGSYIKINPIYQNPNINEWIDASIIKFDGGQVQVQYYNKYDDKTYYLWIHLDNKSEILFSSDNNNNNDNNYLQNKNVMNEINMKEINSFKSHLQKTNWSIDINEKNRMNYDKIHSLFLCIAKEINGDYKSFNRIRNEFNEYKRDNINYFNSKKYQNNDCNDLIKNEDKINIEMLSELYNVKIKVYEQEYDHLVETFYTGNYENTQQLPMIILAIPYKYEFFVINNPNCKYERPLRICNQVCFVVVICFYQCQKPSNTDFFFLILR